MGKIGVWLKRLRRNFFISGIISVLVFTGEHMVGEYIVHYLEEHNIGLANLFQWISNHTAISTGILFFAVLVILLVIDIWRERKADNRALLRKLVPKSFGLDTGNVRRVGFAVENPQADCIVRLEMYWYSGATKPDEMQLRYPLNLTSHHLRKTPDGQFILAIAWLYMPYGYSLVLNDGYYGLFVNPGYYKARISLSNQNHEQKNCFDLLLHYGGRDAIRVKEIKEIDCDDPLKYIPANERVDWEDEEVKNWSTVPNFQPNQMYK